MKTNAMRRCMISIAVFSMAAMALPAVAAPEGDYRIAGMVIVGLTIWAKNELHFLDASAADGSARTHAEADMMPTFGLGGQMLLSCDEKISFGLEAAALFGCASDDADVRALQGLLSFASGR